MRFLILLLSLSLASFAFAQDSGELPEGLDYQRVPGGVEFFDCQFMRTAITEIGGFAAGDGQNIPLNARKDIVKLAYEADDDAFFIVMGTSADPMRWRSGAFVFAQPYWHLFDRLAAECRGQVVADLLRDCGANVIVREPLLNVDHRGVFVITMERCEEGLGVFLNEDSILDLIADAIEKHHNFLVDNWPEPYTLNHFGAGVEAVWTSGGEPIFTPTLRAQLSFLDGTCFGAFIGAHPYDSSQFGDTHHLLWGFDGSVGISSVFESVFRFAHTEQALTATNNYIQQSDSFFFLLEFTPRSGRISIHAGPGVSYLDNLNSTRKVKLGANAGLTLWF